MAERLRPFNLACMLMEFSKAERCLTEWRLVNRAGDCRGPDLPSQSSKIALSILQAIQIEPHSCERGLMSAGKQERAGPRQSLSMKRRVCLILDSSPIMSPQAPLGAPALLCPDFVVICDPPGLLESRWKPNLQFQASQSLKPKAWCN